FVRALLIPLCILVTSAPLFVFVSGYVSHRDLHSFPTRRSSDLAGRGLRGPGAGSVPLFGPGPRPRRAAGGRQQPCAALALGRHRDRKSTRLNSSHVKISYAVFCLKKKNTEHHRALWSASAVQDT